MRDIDEIEDLDDLEPDGEGAPSLCEHYSFRAGKGQEPLRVDKFLMNFVENATRNKVQQAAKQGNIFRMDRH